MIILCACEVEQLVQPTGVLPVQAGKYYLLYLYVVARHQPNGRYVICKNSVLPLLTCSARPYLGHARIAIQCFAQFACHLADLYIQGWTKEREQYWVNSACEFWWEIQFLAQAWILDVCSEEQSLPDLACTRICLGLGKQKTCANSRTSTPSFHSSHSVGNN